MPSLRPKYYFRQLIHKWRRLRVPPIFFYECHFVSITIITTFKLFLVCDIVVCVHLMNDISGEN